MPASSAASENVAQESLRGADGTEPRQVTKGEWEVRTLYGVDETARLVYFSCTDDRAIPVPLQRSSAARVDEVVEMPTSHSPFLSRPDDLARLLAGYATAAR